jgi:hypothetical protein
VSHPLGPNTVTGTVTVTVTGSVTVTGTVTVTVTGTVTVTVTGTVTVTVTVAWFRREARKGPDVAQIYAPCTWCVEYQFSGDSTQS